MSVDPERPDPELPQDPGIPGPKTPEELPPQDEPEVDQVPDAEEPDADDEGHMTPDEPREPASGSSSRDELRPANRAQPVGHAVAELLMPVR
jgi:hypothetical protein